MVEIWASGGLHGRQNVDRQCSMSRVYTDIRPLHRTAAITIKACSYCDAENLSDHAIHVRGRSKGRCGS